jgi:hypothetical protein
VKIVHAVHTDWGSYSSSREDTVALFEAQADAKALAAVLLELEGEKADAREDFRAYTFPLAVYAPGEQPQLAAGLFVSGRINAAGEVTDRHDSELELRWEYELIHGPSCTRSEQRKHGKVRVHYAFALWTTPEQADEQIAALAARIVSGEETGS